MNSIFYDTDPSNMDEVWVDPIQDSVQLVDKGSMPGDPDFDPMCDPTKPRVVTFQDVSAASYRISSGIIKTPCTLSHMRSFTGMEVYLKCEFLQFTGSFKERGARNAILQLDDEAKKRGIIAASLGNHSQGVSYHGTMLKVPTTVVMPGVAPLVKIEKCKAYGANVIIHGHNITEAKYHALSLAKERKLTYINGYDHPAIIAGQGTVGLEILEQVPDVQAILVPVGGGGLLAGILIAVKHLKPQVLVYGVETEKCASMTTSLKEGKVTPYTISSTLADGLAVGFVGVNSFHNIKPLVNKMIVVTEDWASRSILRIVELEKYVVEGGGAVATAAILSGQVNELKGKKVVCVLSGGNIDTSLLSACMERGLVAEQRLIKFKVNINSSAGSLATLCNHIASLGVSIKEINQERAWLEGSIFNVRVKVICETRGPEHVEQLRSLISTNYKDAYFLKKSDGAGPSHRHISLTDSLERIGGKDEPPCCCETECKNLKACTHGK